MCKKHPNVGFTAKEAYAVFRFNQFGHQDFKDVIQSSLNPKDYDSIEHESAVFPLTSMLNHACLSNCNYQFIGNFIFIRTSKDIKEGDELLISYVL
jgi:hypothetical protein